MDEQAGWGAAIVFALGNFIQWLSKRRSRVLAEQSAEMQLRGDRLDLVSRLETLLDEAKAELLTTRTEAEKLRHEHTRTIAEVQECKESSAILKRTMEDANERLKAQVDALAGELVALQRRLSDAATGGTPK